MYIDQTVGLMYCGNMPDLYKEVVAEYIETAKESIPLMRRYFAAGDLYNYEIIVHALKSTSLSIGATELSEQAKAHEMAAKSEDKDFISADLEALIAFYEAVLAEASVLIK